MGREDYEIFGVLKKERQDEAEQSRQLATQMFRDALKKAHTFGFTLVRHSDTHYKVRTKDWVLEVYPGNQRIYRHPGSKAPFLRLPEDRNWNLNDIVEAVAKALKPPPKG